MTKQAVQRDPAIELYRMLLMLGIVTLHTLQCAGLGFSPLARWVEFCVDGFVFISGWYGIRFEWKKVVRLYGLALWCSAIYAAVRWVCFESAPWSVGAYLDEVVHRAEAYWFVNAYVVLMCLTPIINAPFESRKSRRVFVPFLFAVFGWSFAAMVPGLKAWVPAPTGFGSHTFLTLSGVYVIARIARIGKWDDKLQTWHLMLVLAVLSALAVCNLNKYNSPVAVMLGWTLFALFSRIKFASEHGMVIKIILQLSPSMLAVYLLHGCGADFLFVKSALVYFADPKLACLIAIPLIFFACAAIDLLRRQILIVFKTMIRIWPDLSRSR